MPKFYHVFTDNKDCYLPDIHAALGAFQNYIDNDEENIRLYEETHDSEDCTDDEPEENCLLSLGSFPA